MLLNNCEVKLRGFGGLRKESQHILPLQRRECATLLSSAALPWPQGGRGQPFSCHT